jgi:glycosyltransferase involved in cell wall biosynthesis
MTAIKAAVRREYPNVGNVIIFEKPRGYRLFLAMSQIFMTGYHPALGRYRNSLLTNWLSINAVEGAYDLIHFDMFHVAPYRKFCKDIPTLLVSSDAYSKAAKDTISLSRNVKSRLRTPIEAMLLRNFERKEYPKFNMVCTVSTVDAEYLHSVAMSTILRTIGIAVDPDFSEREISHFVNDSDNKILCTGNLGHGVISDGIVDFLTRDLASIRTVEPDIKVTVLGKNPTSRLKRCIADTNGVEHIDYVKNYADFLDQDWIYVYPQRCATGLQTKVQQAMALGLPVVGYEVSFGGLSVKSGTHCFICNSGNNVVESVISLAGDVNLRREIGLSAARYVREKFSVKRVGSQMLSLYDEAILLAKSD